MTTREQKLRELVERWRRSAIEDQANGWTSWPQKTCADELAAALAKCGERES